MYQNSLLKEYKSNPDNIEPKRVETLPDLFLPLLPFLDRYEDVYEAVNGQFYYGFAILDNRFFNVYNDLLDKKDSMKVAKYYTFRLNKSRNQYYFGRR